MKVEILGTEYECRRLSAAERLEWNLYLHYECERTFYSDLFALVEHLPACLQVEVIRKHSPPARLDSSMAIYYKLAVKPAAVRFLLDRVITHAVPKVTEENATYILMAIRHLIFDKAEPVTHDTEEKQKAALDTFKNLEGSD